MAKIAIVGVEGSGKTVLMAAFGEKYERPDSEGYFLEPKDRQTFQTTALQTANMRHEGKWPSATLADAVSSLDWRLCRRKGAGAVGNHLKKE